MSLSGRCIVKLNQRIYSLHSSKGLKALEKLLNSLIKALRVRVSEYSIKSDGWVEVSLEGEDLEVCLNLLSTVIGILPKTSLDVSEGRILKCRVLTLNQDGLYVDAGLGNTVITVPMGILKSQVFDGCNMTIENLESLYMLYTDFPVELYVREVHNSSVVCALSWRWLNWAEEIASSGLSRVYIAGVDIDTVENIIDRKPYRDYVLDRIRLGVLETLLLVDPSASLYKLSNYIEKNLKPSILKFSKPSKRLRKLSYTFQDKAWFNPPPPFQIP
ncbi:DUF2110 family protein [Candidatus Bathyarchaeota archaeon]|nr:DUF2110 family protein [Candidatus Bathyarchaeota archaeon]MBS7613390.1 DUF2110 family protein [Candidatus Bathyarchaeota archaeon]MBS7617118.1 DUF2110 family protein [Candidatus Bathyarchaeota archaeon]